MAVSVPDPIMEPFRRSPLQRGVSLSDGQLLSCFIEQRDESAFEVLVRRHGPMVLGVCLRILRNPHDAEDAFQAAFLVLARKANTIWPREMTANWLYGVARQTAHKARALADRRKTREKQVEMFPEPAASPDDEGNALTPLLERELNGLPAVYRLPIVLCDLEGKGHLEAAEQLGWPQGTLSGRLSRARALLAKRLRSRGLAFSCAALTGLLARETASAAVPASLVISTVKAATPVAAGQAAAGCLSAEVVALTEAMMKTMFLKKLKVAAAALLVVLLAAFGTGVFLEQANAQRPKEPARGEGRDERGQGTEIRGIIKSIDAAQNTITAMVAATREAPEEKTYTIAKDAEIGVMDTTNGRGALKEAKLADLSPGLAVFLSLSADQKTVTSISAEGPMARGMIKAADAAKHTVTIVQFNVGRGEEPSDKTYTLAADAEIGVNDGRNRRFSIKEGKPTDLVPNAQVTLWLSIDQKTVVGALVEGTMWNGTLKSLDASKNSITLATAAEGRGMEGAEEKTVELAKDATILLDDGRGRRLSVKEGKLADIPVGSRINARLSADLKSVTVLRAEGPSLPGMLKSVDSLKGTVTIVTVQGRDDGNREEKTLTLAKDARLLIDGKLVKLDEIKPDENGPFVQVRLSLDQKTVQMVQGGSRSRDR